MALGNATAYALRVVTMVPDEAQAPALVAVGFLGLLAIIRVAAHYIMPSHPPPAHVQRLSSLQYVYVAKTTVKSPQATHLDFPSPRRPISEVEPTILRDFSPLRMNYQYVPRHLRVQMLKRTL